MSPFLSGDSNRISLIWLLRKLNEQMHFKCLQQYLAHSEHYTSVCWNHYHYSCHISWLSPLLSHDMCPQNERSSTRRDYSHCIRSVWLASQITTNFLKTTEMYSLAVLEAGISMSVSLGWNRGAGKAHSPRRFYSWTPGEYTPRLFQLHVPWLVAAPL